eukprot:5089124-Pyramimonas_sp.AAC.1
MHMRPGDGNETTAQLPGAPARPKYSRACLFSKFLLAEQGCLADDRLHTASVLWDISNYCEHINREELQQRASISNINAAVLSVILNQYQSSRYLTSSQLLQHCGFPRKSIPAGCGFATYLVPQSELASAG